MSLRKCSLLVLAVSVWTYLLSSGSQALAQWGQGYERWHVGPRMMHQWGNGWFGGIFMVILWILIIVGLVFLIRWLIHSTRGVCSAPHRGPSVALDILKERYARGEINKDEFEQKKKDLMD